MYLKHLQQKNKERGVKLLKNAFASIIYRMTICFPLWTERYSWVWLKTSSFRAILYFLIGVFSIFSVWLYKYLHKLVSFYINFRETIYVLSVSESTLVRLLRKAEDYTFAIFLRFRWLVLFVVVVFENPVIESLSLMTLGVFERSLVFFKGLFEYLCLNSKVLFLSILSFRDFI